MILDPTDIHFMDKKSFYKMSSLSSKEDKTALKQQ